MGRCWMVLASVSEGEPGLRATFNGVANGFRFVSLDFEEAGWDAIVNISPLSSLASLELADASAMKQIFSSRSHYPKPLELPVYQQLASFGRNLVVSEGEEWKRYRRISGPAFGERNIRLVFTETVKIVNSLFEDVWKNSETIVLDHAPDLTLELSLLVIGSAGFGRPISWSSQQEEFKTTLNRVSGGLMLKLVLNNLQLSQWAPRWVERGVEGVVDWVIDLVRGAGTSETRKTHGTSTKQVRQAFRDFDHSMREMIDARRSGGGVAYDGKGMGTGRDDLFNLLLDANEAYQDGGLEKEEDGVQGGKLTDEELIGNVFMFLLAGHETTAYTFSWVLAMLALYPEEQEALYQHIKEVIPDGRDPTYEDIPSLTRVLAVIYEALRMFSTGAVRKTCEEDTVVTVSNIHGQTRIVPIPKGTEIVMNSFGVHYNPRYWPNPNTFDPSRFLSSSPQGDYPRDAFIPFAAGARSCIGRKFSETESIAFVTLLVGKYRIELKDDEEFKLRGESFEEKQRRILRGFQGISLVPYRIPLVLRRREG
ncbi:hypothetical protein D9758_016006 [Tetrapyrgos nigripes]|uniref:Cytochrome P450 n=1 Tax=Tetrapyrgos nigripes TaxID=182062 RepID=A0A8H5CJY4_9AGAR|nr:hypothetical protein D9758_016006 [Tetrapyrgos nigripes]